MWYVGKILRIKGRYNIILKSILLTDHMTLCQRTHDKLYDSKGNYSTVVVADFMAIANHSISDAVAHFSQSNCDSPVKVK